MTDKDQVFAKCAWRLIPFMVLLYVINYLDRVNVGFAALTMNPDLGLSPTIYGFGGSLFFIGYMVFQVPVGAHPGTVRRPAHGVLDPAGLGRHLGRECARSGRDELLPRPLPSRRGGGRILPRHDLLSDAVVPAAYRARVNAYFYSGIPLAFVLGGPLSSLILEMDGIAGLRGWQWLFIVEGLPACFLAFAALRLLPDGPRQAKWLTPEEQATVTSRVAADDKAEQRSLWPALSDPRVIALGMAYAGWQFGFYGLGLWLPQIVQSMGFDNFTNGFITALPFLAAIVAMNLWSRSSDARGERIWHVAIAALISAAGFAAASAASAAGSSIGVIIGLTFAASGLISYMPPFLSLPPDLPGRDGGRGGIGLVSSLGRIGAALGPLVVGLLRQETGDYSAAIATMAVGQMLAAVIVLGMGWTIKRPKPALGR